MGDVGAHSIGADAVVGEGVCVAVVMFGFVALGGGLEADPVERELAFVSFVSLDWGGGTKDIRSSAADTSIHGC